MSYEEVVEDLRGWLDLRARPGHYSSVLLEQLAHAHKARTISTLRSSMRLGSSKELGDEVW